jgi:SAM-dependent methyltransferase
MATPTAPPTGYVLGRTQAEHHRLNRQGRLISKLTRHFLEEVGLAPGMRVLDAGSGVGDVALLAARAVGSSGQVVCVDTDASALAVAKERATGEGFSNVLFHSCDFHRYRTSVAFDAVIGRCLLLHQADPLATVQAALNHLRPGGIIAFQEPWFSRALSYPEAPLFQEMIGWLHDTVQASDLDSDIGVRLPSLFTSAGLPRPKLSFEMLVDCDVDSEIYDFCTDTVRSLLPHIEEVGISSAAEIQVDTLAQRLRREASALGTVIGVMPLMGAWSRKP